MAKISVIIPAYNAEKTIKEAIESVLAQTYDAHEIIVVDDGSGDRTREIVEGFIGHQVTKTPCHRGPMSPVKYIYQENQGPAAARNRGIREAAGEYIAFLDADDLWKPEKLEKQIVLLENSAYAMIFCDMSHEVDGRLVYKSYLGRKRKRYISSGNIFEDLLKENFVFTPTVLAKKDIFDKTGYFDESYKICEDYKMWLRIARDYPVRFLNEALVIRRRNDSNITGDKLLYITSGIRLFEELLNNDGYDPDIKNIIRNEYYRRFFDLGYYYWDKGDMTLAKKNFLKTMAYKGNILKSIPYVAASYLPSGARRALRALKGGRGICCRIYL